jgi:predicted Na+-dependent transporter
MQIVGFIILLLILIAILSVNKEQLGPKQKGALIALILAIIFIGAGYEYYVSKKTKQKREIILHFTQGGTLTCKGVKVDSKHYNYENGTASFVAKGKFSQIKGNIVSIDDCEVSSQ